MKVLTNLNFGSSYARLFTHSDFPTTPEEGMLVYKDDGILYIYNEIDTVLSWRPLNVKSRSYVHNQGPTATSWTINHNLDSDDIIYFVYDLNDDMHTPSDQTFTDSNNMTLTFTESINGRAVIFAIGDSYASSGLNLALNSGTSNFVGLGSEVTITHQLGQIPSFVNIVPTENPDGYLGEMWVRKDETNIYVGNTGEFTGGFSWVAYR